MKYLGKNRRPVCTAATAVVRAVTGSKTVQRNQSLLSHIFRKKQMVNTDSLSSDHSYAILEIRRHDTQYIDFNNL